jgi:hypothetical protein
MVKNAKITEQANHIAVFQETSICRVWHNEEWWFSVVAVCAILTASPDAGAYRRKLKQRLNAEGGQPVTFYHGLKLQNRYLPTSWLRRSASKDSLRAASPGMQSGTLPALARLADRVSIAFHNSAIW